MDAVIKKKLLSVDIILTNLQIIFDQTRQKNEPGWFWTTTAPRVTCLTKDISVSLNF
jgi:hypothetical protein